MKSIVAGPLRLRGSRGRPSLFRLFEETTNVRDGFLLFFYSSIALFGLNTLLLKGNDVGNSQMLWPVSSSHPLRQLCLAMPWGEKTSKHEQFGGSSRDCLGLVRVCLWVCVCVLGWASPTYPVSAGAFKQALSNLRPQKTEKIKDRNFCPWEAREFLGSGNTVKTQKFHTSGVRLREDKNSGQKFEFSEFTSLGCWSLEWRDLSGPLKFWGR